MIDFLVSINECSSAGLAMLMQVVKRTLSIIRIVAPIILLISLAMNLSKLMSNPDNKKLLPKIRNSAIAAVVIFFIPTIVNAAMAMLSNDYNLSACWNETVEQNYKTPSYVDPGTSTGGSGGTKNILQNPSDYQKGTPKPSPSSSTSGSTSTTGEDTGNGGGTTGGGSSSTGGDTGNSNGTTGGGLSTTPGTVSGAVEVHFINPNSRVDAIYIKAGGQSIFVDGGFKGDAKREIAYLDKIGVTHIDYYLASHSHKDHVEAAPPIIQKYGISKVLVGRETCSGSGSEACSWYAIKGFASNQKISLNGVTSTILSPGSVFYLGGLKITCIGPINVTNGLAKGDVKQNYNSLILRLDYGSTSFMLTGDNSSSSVIKKINESYPGMLNVDVLKNAHHNGCTSNSTYQLYNAEYVVFPTRNDYLPSNSCINTLKKYGTKNYYIVASGHSGNVLFTSDGNNINVYEHYKD